MTVRVYRWDDASAPVLTGQAGSRAALLKACLVTGYGSNTAAGWSNPYAATNIEAFTNSSTGGTGYGILVTDTNAQYASMVGYESITGGGVLTNQFPTSAQVATGLVIFSSVTADATPRPWLLVADEKRFYLWIGHNVTTTTGLATTGYAQLFFAGDLIGLNAADPYRFMVVGGATAAATTNYVGGIASNVNNGLTVQGHYLARNYAGATISKPCGKTASNLQTGVTIMGTAGVSYPDQVSGGMLLSKVYVNDADTSYQIRGLMPGLFNPLHNLPGNPGDVFSGVGPLSGKSFILLDVPSGTNRGRVVLETSSTWE